MGQGMAQSYIYEYTCTVGQDYIHIHVYRIYTSIHSGKDCIHIHQCIPHMYEYTLR